MLARIEENAVRELRRDLTMDEVPEHKRGLWREVPPRPDIDPRLGTLTGPHFEGGAVVWGFSAKPLEAVKVALAADLDAVRIRRGKEIVAGRDAPNEKLDLYREKATWAINSAPHPGLNNEVYDDCLAPEAAARGMTVKELAVLILSKRDPNLTCLGRIEGAHAAAKAAIEAATTVEGALAACDAGIQAIGEIG